MGVNENASALIRQGIRRRLISFAYGRDTANAMFAPQTKKEIKPSDPTWKRIFSGWGSEKEELTEPFKQLPIIRAAITAKASNVAQVPFRIRLIGAEEPLEKGPIIDLFNNVNPHMSKYDLWEAVVINEEGWGDAPVFLDPDDERGPDIPAYLWPELSSSVSAKFYRDQFVGWELTRGGRRIFFLPDRVIMVKNYNPWSKLRGLSKLSALILTTESDFSAIKYNQVIFENDVTTGMVFSTPSDSVLDDADFERVQQELIEKRRGYKNTMRALILQGGMTAQDMRPTNRDMQFVDLRKFNREDVAMVFKVPKSELELYEDVNYATSMSQDRGFWKKTLIPLMNKIADKFNTDFLYPRGYEGYFDVRAVDVLNAEVLEKAQAALTFVDMGWPLNMVNQRLNLGFPDVAWGDEPMTPLMPMLFEKPDTTKSIDEGSVDLETATAEWRKKRWLQIVQIIAPVTSACARDVGNYFFRVEQRMIQRLVKRVDGVSRVKTVLKADPPVFDWIDDMFDTEELKNIIAQFVTRGANIGIGSIKTNVRMPVDPMVRAIAAARVGSKITDINRNAATYMRLKLARIVDDSISQGWTEQQLADAIVSGLKDGMHNIRRRAKTIARTEVHGAFSHGRHDAIMQTKPKRRRWLATHDDKVREAHEDLDGVAVGPDEPWETPLGKIMYPHDPDADAGNVINCRCAEVAEYE